MGGEELWEGRDYRRGGGLWEELWEGRSYVEEENASNHLHTRIFSPAENGPVSLPQ